MIKEEIQNILKENLGLPNGTKVKFINNKGKLVSGTIDAASLAKKYGMTEGNDKQTLKNVINLLKKSSNSTWDYTTLKNSNPELHKKVVGLLKNVGIDFKPKQVISVPILKKYLKDLDEGIIKEGFDRLNFN